MPIKSIDTIVLVTVTLVRFRIYNSELLVIGT